MKNKRLSIIKDITFIFTFLITRFTLKNKSNSKNKIENCEINYIKNIPNNSPLIVGHAYGSPKTYCEFISSRLENVLLENSSKINNLKTIYIMNIIFNILKIYFPNLI